MFPTDAVTNLAALRSLVGYSPQGRKESDSTERLHASAYDAGDPGSIPGLGRSPGEGHVNPLLYSCLGNPMNRGAWQAI